jgi:hypothetical protein
MVLSLVAIESPRKSNSLSTSVQWLSALEQPNVDLRPAIRAAVIIKGTLKEGVGHDASYVLSYGGPQFNREAVELFALSLS